MNNKKIKVALVLSGIALFVLGVMLLLKSLIPFNPHISAISIVNTTIISIAGAIPLAAAILMHLDKVKKESNYKLLKALANFWIFFAAVSCVYVLILNLFF